jgi:hypothetical protein
MSSFLITLLTLFFSVYRFFFSKSHLEKNPKSLLHHIQYPLHIRGYKLIFICASLAYFVFFGFVSNIFIYFIDDNTIFSLIPSPSSTHKSTERGHIVNTSTTDIYGNTHVQRNNQTSQHQGLQHESSPDSINSNRQSTATTQIQDYRGITSSEAYPNSQLIICCNTIGYIPMLIVKLTENFSILIIPLNLLIATTLSILVGLNISLNIYLLSRKKSIKLSRKNYFGVLGISTGLFVGCPTCTGSLFYSLVGFGSLVFFSSLNFFQIIFVVISIPMLFISLLIMMRVLQNSFLDSCKL